jgi:hypothetical protein
MQDIPEQWQRFWTRRIRQPVHVPIALQPLTYKKSESGEDAANDESNLAENEESHMSMQLWRGRCFERWSLAPRCTIVS